MCDLILVQLYFTKTQKTTLGRMVKLKEKAKLDRGQNSSHHINSVKPHCSEPPFVKTDTVRP